MKKIIFYYLLLIVLSSCASIVSDSTQKIAINTYPDKAKISITNSNGIVVQQVTTPSVVILSKSDGYFSGETYHITVEKDGFVSQTKLIESSANGWYMFGNLLFGGLIGWLIVDPMTGAMYKLEPNEFNVKLEKDII